MYLAVLRRSDVSVRYDASYRYLPVAAVRTSIVRTSMDIDCCEGWMDVCVAPPVTTMSNTY